MVGYIESPIPNKLLSEGLSVMAAIRLPQLIVNEAIIVDVGKIEQPRLSLLLRNGRLVGRLELDPNTHWELKGPTLQSVLQAIPSGNQIVVLQITGERKMQIWLNGNLGGEVALPQDLSGTVSGACRQLASFEQDRAAADIALGASSLGDPLSEQQIKNLTRRIMQRLNATNPR
jgi:hypothetical protein